MRRANALELSHFPRIVFPDDWNISHQPEIDPEAVSDHPPIGHVFEGEWPNIRCVPIRNNDQGVSTVGRGRGRGSLLALKHMAAQERRAGEAVSAESDQEHTKDREYNESVHKSARSFPGVEHLGVEHETSRRRVIFASEVDQYNDNTLTDPVENVIHNKGCDTLKEWISFPTEDTVLRNATFKELLRHRVKGSGTTHHDSLQTGGSAEAINKQPIYDGLSDDVENDTKRSILASEDCTVTWMSPTSRTPARVDINPPVLVGMLDETEAQVLMKSHSGVESDKGNKCGVDQEFDREGKCTQFELEDRCSFSPGSAGEVLSPHNTRADEVLPLHTANADNVDPLHTTSADADLQLHTGSTYEVNSLHSASPELLIRLFWSSNNNFK